MASFNKINSFVEAVAEKVHNLQSDTLTLALTASANAPVATNTQLSNLTQISYTNLSSRVLTVSSSAQSSGTYKLVIADIVLTASGGAVAAFRYVVIYNDTATNDELIGWYDYGSDLTLNNGESLTVDFDGTITVVTTHNAEYGGGGGGGKTATPTSSVGGGSLYGGGGGGSGGSHNATPAIVAGAAGGASGTYSAGTGGAVGTDGASPTAGSAGADGNSSKGGAGGGGGGTTVTASTAGANGGAGGRGGGGGGGGGCGTNPGVGGNGGAGGNGYAVVMTW